MGQRNSGASPFKTGLSNEHFFKSCAQFLLEKNKKQKKQNKKIYIFIGTFAPKWPLALHKLAPFALGESRNTLGY